MNHPSVQAVALVCAMLLPASAAIAQQSAQHRIEESAFNNGGQPRDGTVPQSASHAIALGALGDTVAAPLAPSSAGFTIDAGFVSAYVPPREVANLRFEDATTLVWDPDPTVGDYALYVGTISVPFDTGFGACELPSLPSATAQATSPVPHGATFFYLVTSRNRLREESTKGAGRTNPAPCP